MDAHRIAPSEKVSAARKLGREQALALAGDADRLIISRGKKVSEFTPPDPAEEATIDLMLGSTGNLRAPTLRVGATVLVGFNEQRYAEVLL